MEDNEDREWAGDAAGKVNNGAEGKKIKGDLDMSKDDEGFDIIGCRGFQTPGDDEKDGIVKEHEETKGGEGCKRQRET
jgi:hypothetical protein